MGNAVLKSLLHKFNQIPAERFYDGYLSFGQLFLTVLSHRSIKSRKNWLHTLKVSVNFTGSILLSNPSILPGGESCFGDSKLCPSITPAFPEQWLLL